MKVLLKFLICVFTVIFIAGCGGGSSSTESGSAPETGSVVEGPANPGPDISRPQVEDQDDSATVRPRPLVDAGRDQYADANVALTLTGNAQSRSGEGIIHTRWVQRYGPDLELPAPDALSNVFVTPDVTSPTRLTFELFATDANGQTGSDIVNLFINPLQSSVRITSNSVNESAGTVSLRVILSNPQSMPLSMDFETQSGSATSGQDFRATSGRLRFSPGETEKTITVPLINDSLTEADEIFYVRIANLTNGTYAQRTGTIIIRGGESGNPELRTQNIAFVNAGPVMTNVGASFTNVARSVSESQYGTGAVTYVSSAPDIAAVDSATGEVTALATGQAIITALKAADASYRGANASYRVVVSKQQQQIAFADPGPLQMEIFTSLVNQIDPDPVTAPGSGEIRYASSNPDVATVDPLTGEIEALTLGQTTITAIKAEDDTYASARSNFLLSVTLPDSGKLEQSISLSRTGPLSGQIGDQIQLTLADSGQSTGEITWFSNNAGIASVSSSGLVTLLAEGTAQITVTKEGDDIYLPVDDSLIFNVQKLPQSIGFLNDGPITDYIGAEIDNPVAAGSPGSGLITFSSDAPQIASVDPASGIVSLVSAGTATITATKAADAQYEEATATYQIISEKLPQELIFSQEQLNGVAGTTVSNPAIGQGTGAITYSSDNPAVATVDSVTGEISLLQSGTANITATIAEDDIYLSQSAVYTATVDRATQTLTFATPGTLSGQAGGSLTNTATGEGSGTITYASSAPSVAQVDASSGAVTLISSGTATITATIASDNIYEGAQASYVIQVNLNTVVLSFADSGPIAGFVNDSFTNSLAVNPPSAAGGISYSSSDTSVASVNSASGEVTLTGAGEAVITASRNADGVYASASLSYSVTSNLQPQSLSFASPGPLTISVDETVTNTASGSGTGAITYSSSQPAVASINSNTGQVTGNTAGTAVITATMAADGEFEGASAQYTLNVERLNQTLTFSTSGVLDGVVGQSYKNDATAPGSGTISYSSADPAIASVDSAGTVSLNASGSTTITASITQDARYNAASNSYTVTASNDITPDAFELGTITGAILDSKANSNTITISGLSSTASMSITGGAYELNSGMQRTDTTTVSNGDTVTVIIDTGSTPDQTYTAVLTVGSFSDDFVVTTVAADTSPDSFSFIDFTDADTGSSATSDEVTITGINTAAPVQVINGEYSINGGPFTTADGTIDNADRIQLKTQSSATSGQTVTVTLTIGGVSADWNVTTVSNTAPEARNVTLTDSNDGLAQVGDTITASYTYFDADGDPEGATSYRWRSRGNVVSGATGSSYTLTRGDVPGKIKVEITPRAQTGELVGTTQTDEIPTGSPPLVTGVATYLDSNFNSTVDSGDQLIVPFNTLIRVGTGSEDDFNLPVSGDSLGTGAGLAATYPSGNSSVTVTLGDFPSFNSVGTFVSADVSPGGSSGIDVSDNLATADVIEDFWSGLDAVPSDPIDIFPGYVFDNKPFGGSNSRDIALGDLDGDGDLDIVVANHGANTVWINQGEGNYLSNGQSLGTADTEALQLNDIDGDLDLDVVTCNFSNEGNRVYRNNGSGNFSDTGQIIGDAACQDMDMADVDGDGDIDLVLANVGTSGTNNLTRVWLNNGSGVFIDSGQSLGKDNSISVALGYLNKDPYPDMVIGLRLKPAWVLINDGTGVFNTDGQTIGFYAHDIEISDMNADGREDVILAQDGGLEVWTTVTTAGQLNQTTSLGSSDNAYSLFVTKIDGDELPDLITADPNDYSLGLYINQGDGILERAGISVSTEGRAISGLAAGDIDADSDYDLILPATSYLGQPLGNLIYKHSLSSSGAP